MSKTLAVALVAAVSAFGIGSAAKADGWWPMAQSATPASERWVSHSSYKLILQRNGRYVKDTIRSSLIAAPAAVQAAAPHVARRLAPAAGTAAVTVTAPAWAPVVGGGLAVAGAAYGGYELYNYMTGE
jgi:hypothetical protein